jgi:uncharacterized repeat protein (TIGR03803 family)
MRGKKLSVRLIALLATFSAALLTTGSRALAQEEMVLHSFNGKNGSTPYAGLIFDAAGNLYGSTFSGGAYGDGTVFELTPETGGGWTETVLHSFNGNDGSAPYAGLIFDAAGNLYGTTYGGGAYGDGTVFELTPEAGGGWTETLLHTFNGNDGQFTYAGLIFDTASNLYGTTLSGGAHGNGTVFELTPEAGGSWTETVLHNFYDNGKDGNNPYASLIFDTAGSLYGTTYGGGVYGDGTVFELTPEAGGGWTETILHNFSNSTTDGIGLYPYAGLVFDAAGNLYGTTEEGSYGYGSLFELTPKAGGQWTAKLLLPFGWYGKDGKYPAAGLIFDAAGNLYGTTHGGGAHVSGTVFELNPEAPYHSQTILHSFEDNGQDGVNPYAGVIFDAAGNLYGTTLSGGAFNQGTVFEITP